ncbi:Deoxyribose-phosphate aldolase [Lachnellula hyalina]|uniref:deoxyribose-phosphate aldolase n=1 Tax=Lachnellula hyalina TaxID=1316788 RepID=A0A8H8R7P2_9HELO|nr:Deoxyribose-phosphate aldolase [Lachnellula hyalina]TVY29070.1 Deoxyribose-phosphate aldolase [Lachnellula hyalina]
MAARPTTINVSLPSIAKMIDHLLLDPIMTDDEVLAGLEICKKYNVATTCVKPYHILYAKKHLAGTGVLVCPAIGFPHGGSTTEVKLFETKRAVYEGGKEVDFVINIGRARSGKWEFVKHEIFRVNEAVVEGGAILKVIFENEYLTEDEVIKLCQICTEVDVAYVETSTGYDFTKLPSGDYECKGATISHLELMRKHVGPDVKIKATGGVRTLDDLLRMRALGVSRVGTTSTGGILEEAIKRGIGMESRSVEINWEGV